MQSRELSHSEDVGRGFISIKKRRRRVTVSIDPSAFVDFFLLLVHLRAANASSLFELYFKPKSVPLRTAMRRLRQLVDEGFLSHLRLDGARCVYHLTPKALAVAPEITKWAHASLVSTPPDRQAMYCWLRSSMHAALTAEGWIVGSNGHALYGLRRFLIDTLEDRLKACRDTERIRLAHNLKGLRESAELVVRQSDLLGAHRWRCRECGIVVRAPGEHHDPTTRARCAGAFRAVPVTPLDIAWRKRGEKYDAIVLFVDNPSLPLERQLDDINKVLFGDPLLPMIIRAVDSRSAFDRATMKWVEIGRRHAAFKKAFAPLGYMHGRVREIDFRPDLQAYVVR